MPRRRRRRRVGFRPSTTYFGPERSESPSEVILKVDEFEAIRLKDFEGLTQDEAAERMGISQPTLHRTLVSARKKIADALTNGKAIRIEGGDYKMIGEGRGRGKGGSDARGPPQQGGKDRDG